MIDHGEYRRRVYAGVLGKTVGVYMGRPFEGWTKARIEDRFGTIDGYVHEELGKELVVADDDLSGTFTFVRGLEDSNEYARATCEDMGRTWLNYVIEGKSIFWWGGMAHSTEHTAFLRLLQGIRPPESGSMETNGRIVSEQIGAQIFIDAFGMVCPGDAGRAAELARAAARVSHDGEAVHAAVVVAALCAHAFVEHDMDRLLDRAVAEIPPDSLIATVHRDVRAWAREDGDWRATYDRIDERYGYHRYGGNCHVVPNHAIMVMAWAYAGDDFYEAQRIINTAGWDTDCNAANVGSVMGIALGLDRIDERYPFREPIADRLLLPTAEGTFSVSDCLIVARHIAAIGERVMGARAPGGACAAGGTSADAAAMNAGTAGAASAAGGTSAGAPAWHHFGEPGAVHGWQPEAATFAERGRARVENVQHPDDPDSRCLRVTALAGAGVTPAISTPLLARPARDGAAAGYPVDGCPRIAPGTTVTFTLAGCRGEAELVPFLRYLPYGSHAPQGGSGEQVLEGEPTPLSGNPDRLVFPVPEDLGGVATDLGLRFAAHRHGEAKIHLAAVDFSGRAVIDLPAGPQPGAERQLAGWLHDCDVVRDAFPDDPVATAHLGRNKGRGLCVTGTRDWQECAIEAAIGVHGGDAGGLVVRYQGRERYYAARMDRTGVSLIRRRDGEEHVLASAPPDGPPNTMRRLRLEAAGDRITLSRAGKEIASATDTAFADGGAGLLIEQALIDVHSLRIVAQLTPLRY